MILMIWNPQNDYYLSPKEGRCLCPYVSVKVNSEGLATLNVQPPCDIEISSLAPWFPKTGSKGPQFRPISSLTCSKDGHLPLGHDATVTTVPPIADAG